MSLIEYAILLLLVLVGMLIRVVWQQRHAIERLARLQGIHDIWEVADIDKWGS